MTILRVRHPGRIRSATAVTLIAVALLSARRAFAQEPVDVTTIEKIKAEETANSHVMDIMSWLSDVYGPRLTWSPNATRAKDWALKQLQSWGLSNVHEESWDTPVGLGWENERFSLMATAPVPFIVEAVPQAWSGSTTAPVTGPAMMIQAGCIDELREKYTGKLRGAFLMTVPSRDMPVTLFTPPATRLSDSALAVMAAAVAAPPAAGRGAGPGTALSATCQRQALTDSARAAAAGHPGPARAAFSIGDTAIMRWFTAQGVAGILLGDATHTSGDIGTNNGASRLPGVARIPTVHVAQESYGRIARILVKNVPVTLRLDDENTFFPQNTKSFNIVGEIPGTDPSLKSEVVMIGAHFDSWHSGDGATDNGAGSGVMLEAMRLLATLNLHPRRTIRIALWTGEEEGLLGSVAYVTQHFGRWDSTGFHALGERAKLAAYFNLDNGSGKIRGVYLQGIEAERPIFDAWMGPFKSLGMKTLTINNTGGTDHLSFQGVCLPGFQFIQDPLDYGNITHHTNQDVWEHLQPDDMKWNAAVVASFAWQASQRDARLPGPTASQVASYPGTRDCSRVR